MSRWPDPVREPLPVGLVTGEDIEYTLRLTDSFMTRPEDPAYNVVTHGAIYAARAALIECVDVLRVNAIDRKLHGTEDDRREWNRIGQEYVVQKVARKIINDFRTWLPLTYWEKES